MSESTGNDAGPRDGDRDQGRQGPTGELHRSAVKDPDTWATGDEPMTGPQESYLQTLAREANEELPEDLNKAEASKKIDELQGKAGRG